ncbi:MAG: VanW family protein [Clostridia bacterium]
MEKSGAKPKKLRLFTINAVIIALAIVAMAFVCVYSIAFSLVDTRTFADGVVVDDVDIGGKTLKEAVSVLKLKRTDEIEKLSLTINYAGKSYVYSALELGVTSNIESILESAFFLGKNEQSFSEAFNAVKNAEGLKSSLIIDKAVLRTQLKKIAAEGDCPPIAAKAEFDSKERTFKYTEGIVGVVLPIDTSCEKISDKLYAGDYSEITLTGEETESRYNLDALKKNTVLIGVFETKTTANFNRNTNINLMCRYVNGQVILPDETLSINDLVGQRTAKKGFLPAPAIMDGKRLENDLGGGICQLSGTLFNAAIYANLNIVERLPHSWPSDYVEVGLDSTLDWNTKKDLKLKNESEYPVYIAAWLEKSDLGKENTLHVEIYGAPLRNGVTIKVHSDIIESYPPESPKIIYTSSLAPGRVKEVIKPRTGYRTRVYRDFYFEGKLIDSEMVSSSYYKPISGEYLVGEGAHGTPKLPDNTQRPPNNTPNPETTPRPTDLPYETPGSSGENEGEVTPPPYVIPTP